MDILEKASLVQLHYLSGMGSKKLARVKAALGSFRRAWETERQDLLKLLVDPALVETIFEARKNVNISRYGEELSHLSMDIITIEDPDYPEPLKNIAQAPYLLYYRGNLNPLKDLCLAIVGSRRPTAYGRRTARSLGGDLAGRATLISGLARGIDAEAHWGAVEGGGYTIGVLGSGIDIVYPRENRLLFDRICEQGAVVSEFPPGTPPAAGNFPRRNRIISGLSRGVVVVEARRRSGALITADFALEQGRDVFAVPGPVNSQNSEGSNRLIQQGAKLVSSIEDVLEEYIPVETSGNTRLKQPQFLMLDRSEEEVLQYIGYEPVHIDDLLVSAPMGIGVLSTLLLKLEMCGLVSSLPGRYYVKN